MTFRALVRQIDAAADGWLPLKGPHDRRIAAWADLHGWEMSALETHRLLLRQALLNAAIRQAVPNLERWAFPTPLDAMAVEAPPSLADAIYTEVQRLQATLFNPWGELYAALIPQAQRRRIGQFWTGEQVAEWMVGWLLQFHPRSLVDVGCGAGNFLLKAAHNFEGMESATILHGWDVSPLLLNILLAAFIAQQREASWLRLAAQDYLAAALPKETDAVICNPPYTRHHHIAPELKDSLQAFFKKRLSVDVSRQGTLAFHFLLKLVADMPDGARAAVIVPMEVLDARYGRAARRVLCQHTLLSALISFAPQMNAFHKVDVGAAILFFQKGHERQAEVRHLTLHALPTTDELLSCLSPCFGERDLPFGSLVIRSSSELLESPKWLSIAMTEPLSDVWQQSGLVVPLKALAKVVRGIATGANEFFALPTQEVERLALEPFVVRTLHRNREIQDIVLDEARWQALSDAGKRVWLLYLNGDEASPHPQLRTYLSQGEERGYHQRSLVRTRKRWYAMERRDVPSIFFTILTRGNPRFILNRAGVRPLNMFSLIYPNRYVVEAGATEVLWALLNSNFSLSRLHSVSRTYGGSTLKVEPRELDNLPVVNPLALPDDARRQIGAWLEEFDQHQRPFVLMHRINQLVEALLDEKMSITYRSSMPVQLRLLETDSGEGLETRNLKPEDNS